MMVEDQGEHSHDEAAAQQLADKINKLFAVVHPPDRDEYTPTEVARWLKETKDKGPTISLNYLRSLRRGERDNPTLNSLRAIARFFNIDVAYLVSDDEKAREIDRQLGKLEMFRDRLVEGIATRAATFDRPRRQWVLDMLESMPDPQSGSEHDSDEDTGSCR